jgi:hypothetical protein
MFSVVNVTPGNFLTAISNSNAGDTINFAPGSYGVGSGTLQLPGGRTYVGNGAVLAGNGNSVLAVDRSDGIDFSGFVLNGTRVTADSATGFNFHDNTIENVAGDGFITTALANSHIDNNTFTHMGGGVYGYPGDAITVDNNTFDYVVEPVHFSCYAAADGMDVSGNVITHATRIGIELQRCISDLNVSNNYMSDWLQQRGSNDWHMAISCATGGNGNSPYTDQAKNVTISGNVLIQNGPSQTNALWAKSAIEIMGYSNITIQNNYSWNWGSFLLNGAVGQVHSSSNTEVGGQLYQGDGVQWPVAGITGSGDLLYSLNDPNAPASPGVPSTPIVTTNAAPSPSTTAASAAAAKAAAKAAAAAAKAAAAAAAAPTTAKPAPSLAVTLRSTLGVGNLT